MISDKYKNTFELDESNLKNNSEKVENISQRAPENNKENNDTKQNENIASTNSQDIDNINNYVPNTNNNNSSESATAPTLNSSSTSAEYGKLKFDELKNEAKKRGIALTKTAKKVDIIELLQKADSEIK